jgi:subtilisin family serine protease
MINPTKPSSLNQLPRLSLNPQTSEARYESGELILRTRGGVSLQSGSVVDDLGARVLDTFDTPGGLHKSDNGEFLHLKLPPGVSVEQAMAAVAQDARVEFAAPNHVYQLPETIQAKDSSSASRPNDLGFDRLYGLHNEGQTGGTPDADIDAPQAWTLQRGRNQAHNGPIIAVIDTGVDYRHPDLKENMWTNPGEIPGDGIDNDGNGVIDDVHGYNAFDDTGDPMDRQSHGTHVAGTIGAQGNNRTGVVGVNQEANIMAVKIFNDQGSTNAAAIIRGIQYADKMGARVANNSWGGGAPNRGIYAAFAESPAMHLVASGNDGKNNDVSPSYPANYDLRNIISVAATDHNDNLASFSNYGAEQVDLAAPGVDIISTVPGGRYSSMSGTSMAAPHVTGAAALVVSQYPEISNDELRLRLLDSVDAKPQLEGKVVTEGRLNVANALGA